MSRLQGARRILLDHGFLAALRFHRVNRLLVLSPKWACKGVRVWFLTLFSEWLTGVAFRFRYFSTIRLPSDSSYGYGQGSGALATLASVPWFLIGVIGIAWEHASSLFDSAAVGYRSRRGYRDVPVDEDAQILHFEDEE